MENEATILAIGRIERALSKIEKYRPNLAPTANVDLQSKHDALKRETQKAIAELDQILAKGDV
jgi:predicted TIM-barrel fold metal-dependent hydrolase